VVVVSDTSAICYLILIDAIDLLPQLFGELVIPPAVHQELTSHGAPETVRSWVEEAPAWLQIRSVTRELDLQNPTPGYWISPLQGDATTRPGIPPPWYGRGIFTLQDNSPG
jgi:hypothetical protein